jgi:DNA (cytosine-5)-methyltransferase 1
MGFPKSFKLPVSRTQVYRQMGNSVAVPVVRAIAKKIALTLDTIPKQKGKKQ